jgi:hypothetical protein
MAVRAIVLGPHQRDEGKPQLVRLYVALSQSLRRPSVHSGAHRPPNTIGQHSELIH